VAASRAGYDPARVRLLFDQNLSPELLVILADLYGAAREGFVIVSKDADFINAVSCSALRRR